MNINQLQVIVKKDISRYKSANSSAFNAYIKNPGLKLVLFLRFCRFLENKKVFTPIYLLCRLYYRHLCIKFGIDMPSHSQFGGGLYIPHAIAGGIVINANSIVGENVSILSGVVIGGNHTGTPEIGNNVFIGANSIIIGNIRIGNNVTIGAGSTVTRDVPDNAVVYGEASAVKRITVHPTH